MITVGSPGVEYLMCLLLVAQWSGILLLHKWCAGSVDNTPHHRRSLAGSRALCCEGVGHRVLPWRYQLEGAGLCLCVLTTVGLVAV